MMLLAETIDIGPGLIYVIIAVLGAVSTICASFITVWGNKKAAVAAGQEAAEKVAGKVVTDTTAVITKVSENDAKTDELIGSVAKIQTLVNGNTDAMREELKEARAIALEARNYVAEVREQLAALRGVAGQDKAIEAAAIVATTKASESGIGIVDPSNEPGKPGEAKIVVKGGDAEPGSYKRIDTRGMGS